MKAHGHATAAKLCRGAPWCKRMIWAFAHFWYSSWNRSVWSVTHGMKQANPSGSKNWKKKMPKYARLRSNGVEYSRIKQIYSKHFKTCLTRFCPSKPSAQDRFLLRLQLDRILRERHGDPTAFHGLWSRFSHAGFIGVSLIFPPMEHHATSRNYLQYRQIDR